MCARKGAGDCMQFSSRAPLMTRLPDVLFTPSHAVLFLSLVVYVRRARAGSGPRASSLKQSLSFAPMPWPCPSTTPTALAGSRYSLGGPSSVASKRALRFA